MQFDLAYETLRKKHLALLQEIKKLEKEMNDYGDDYHALIELAQDHGLDIQQLSNIEAIIPKLIKRMERLTWSPTSIHYIN